MDPTVKDNVGCEGDSSLITSKEKLQGVLDQQAIAPDAASQKLLDLVTSGQMVCELLCHREDDPKGGPFLMLVKVSLKDQQKYGALLTKISGDDALANLFEPQGPVYLRILRCRPALWKDLKECFTAELSQQNRFLS